MGWNQRALEERLRELPALEREELKRRAGRLRDEARRQSRAARGGERRGSGRGGDLPPWASRLKDADLHLWTLRLLEDSLVAEDEVDADEVVEGGRPGVVVWAGRKVCRILVDGGELIDATLSGPLQREQRAVLAVGDQVLWEDEPPRVLRVLPRATRLARPDPQNPHLERVVVANLELAVIVVAARSPPLRAGLVDRYLVALERGGVTPLLCVNKQDQIRGEDERAELEAALAPYEALGVPVLRCSARTGEGLDALREAVRGRTCAFVGHSGVGKSSLLNALFPALNIEIGELDQRARGRHTTTASELHDLDGTRLVDTPGVRSLGLARMEPAELRWYFPELEALADDCTYRDCTHDHEPGCAVLTAAREGRLPLARLASYHRILKSMEEEA